MSFAKLFLSRVDILVSTDDTEIFEMYCNDPDVICNQLRPEKLSNSQALTKDVIKFEIGKLKKNTKTYGCYSLRAFREVETFLKCMQFLDEGFSSVVTVKDVGGEHPLRMKRLIGDRLINYVDTGKENMDPRQNLPKVYLRSGGIYGIGLKFLKKLVNWFLIVVLV